MKRICTSVFFLMLLITMVPRTAHATTFTFDLRDPAIELIDELNSLSLTQGGLTATLNASPITFNEPP